MNGPLPSILLPLTIPASWLYAAAVKRRNARFDRGVGVQSLDIPIISVGNLTTGGTGKTPMVAWIARQLLDAKARPLIAMRGYRAPVGGLSDEQAEYHELLPNVPVVANADRAAAVRAYLSSYAGVGCVILDDGFQHRQLKRDLDLVLIDATANTLGDRMLPAGNLREPPASLRRADAVIMTHAPAVNQQLSEKIERLHGQPPLTWTRHRWSHLMIVQPDGSAGHEPISWLVGKRVLTLLGVGKPSSIHAQLESLGSRAVVSLPAADHEVYDRQKIEAACGLCRGCDVMVVTGKDWVKVRDLIDWKRWPVPIAVPRLEMEVWDGAAELRERVHSAIRLRESGASTRSA